MASGTLALWLCNAFVASLILAALGLRRWKSQGFAMSDGWLIIALVVNALRMIGDYHINKYGTPLSYSVYLATVPPLEAQSLDFEVTEEQARGLVLTGKLLIPTRVAITIVIWSLNMAVMEVLRRTLLRKCENRQQLCWSIYTVLALTFFVTILSAFIECQPLKLNWALLPDVVNCSFGTAWIMTYEISNITIDYTMGFILIFLLLKPQTTKKQRVRLSVLGIWVIWGVVIMIRVIQGESFIDILQNRIVWGSVEVVFATAVATLPTIYNLLRPAPNESENDLAKEIRGVSEGSTTAINLVREASHQDDWSLGNAVSWDNALIWDEPILADATSVQGNAYKSTRRTSIRSSPVNSPSVETGDRNIWQARRRSPRHSASGSGSSLGMQATEESLQGVLSGWIELDEMDPGSQAREAPTPEFDDAGGRDGGIFVATEIHRGWEDDRRPRIITIPPRAVLNRSMV
ncbi:hypothetical protein F4859DRAFT_514533 [Xylaria cf. heliscus]|nr:hypothetical protein F4859DRAFT_514533 [Xylaria cf. heliscus]